MVTRGRSRGEAHDGNALGSAAAYQREMVRLGEAMMVAEHTFDNLWDANIMVKGMTIRVPSEGDAEYLVVVRADEEGRAVVAFHSDATLATAIKGTLERLKNKTMKWKEDTYASEDS